MIHWEQAIATGGTVAGILGGMAAAYFPVRTRYEAKIAERTAARDREVRRQIADEIRTASDDIKSDTRTQIAASDLRTKEQVDEIKATVREVHDKVAANELKMATQFGGNGGGIRQAINEQGLALATLAGQFQQHVSEAGPSQ